MKNTLSESQSESQFYGQEKIYKILLKIAPPVMLAQLIQALYNIVDSLFVGRYADSGLTALSIIYPIQLLMIALAVGTGVGINTAMAARFGVGQRDKAEEFAGVGTPLAALLWILFALTCWCIMPAYARMSTSSEAVIADVVRYGRITCVFSFGLFLESVWTKILQATGDMKTPMFAQILGALTNIALDPLLIFGLFGLPRMGIAGAAVATVTGQIIAALVVMKKGFRRPPDFRVYRKRIAEIFRLGIPNILMQSAYTFYIFGLNLILSTFSDQAVTALGLYYKWQTFFFIPLGAMQTCIVPVISFNYAARKIHRCKQTLITAIVFGLALMAVGTLCFEAIPGLMLRVFTSDERVVEIGRIGFRFIGISFLPMVTSLIFPVFFQAVASSLKSSLLTVIRTVVLFVPLGFLFSRFGLKWFWLTFPVTECCTSFVGFLFYRQFLEHPYVRKAPMLDREHPQTAIWPSFPGVIVTIAREHGSSGKEIGRLVAARLGVPFYYKEMTALAAQESGLDREFISDINKNAPKRLYNLYLSTKVVHLAVVAQHKVIEKIADNGSCVIVGRAADYVLKDRTHVVRIFIHAPEEYRINQVMNIYGDSREEAADNIRRSDKARAAYYHHISGNRWGEAKNYELVIDSSCGIQEASEKIMEFLHSEQ
ncbi:MAG: MATE family efflux transporter [Lachnospiraceae bacterium]|nr:MATE family efflux transporter [Lachnospiraceae bacterium]